MDLSGSESSNPGHRYDHLAATYELGGNFAFYRHIAAYLAPAFERALTGRALDLGCGTGISTDVWAASAPRLDWTGLDASGAMLGLARAKPRSREIRFTLGEAESLPFGNDEFAAVGSSFAMHWMRPTAIEECRRVLEPGGLLALAIPLASRGSNLSGNLKLLRWIWSARDRMRPLRSQGLALSELEGALSGWRIERMEEVRYIERLGSSAELLDALRSRGSWQAIFGDDAPDIQPIGSEPLEFEWRVGLIAARRI